MLARLPSELEKKVNTIQHELYQADNINCINIETLLKKLPTDPQDQVEKIKAVILTLVDANRTIYNYIEKYVCDSKKINSEAFLRTVIISLMTQLTSKVSRIIDDVLKTSGNLETLFEMLNNLDEYLGQTKTDHAAMKAALKTLQVKVPTRSYKDRLSRNLTLLPEKENILSEEKLENMLNDKNNKVLLQIIEGDGSLTPGRVLDKFPKPEKIDPKSSVGAEGSPDDIKVSAMHQGIAMFSTGYVGKPDGAGIKFIKAYLNNAINTKDSSLKITTDKRFKSEISRMTEIFSVYLAYIAEKTENKSTEQREVLLKSKLNTLEGNLTKISEKGLNEQVKFLRRLEAKLKKHQFERKPKKPLTLDLSHTSSSSSSMMSPSSSGSSLSSRMDGSNHSLGSSYFSLSPSSSNSKRRNHLTVSTSRSITFTDPLSPVSPNSPTSLTDLFSPVSPTSSTSLMDPLSPLSPTSSISSTSSTNSTSKKGRHKRFFTFFTGLSSKEKDKKYQAHETTKLKDDKKHEVQMSALEERLIDYVISNNDLQGSSTAPHTRLETNENINLKDPEKVIFDMFNIETKFGNKVLSPAGCITDFFMNYIKLGYQNNEFINYMDGQTKIQELQLLFIEYFEQAAKNQNKEGLEESVEAVQKLLKNYENNWEKINTIITTMRSYLKDFSQDPMNTEVNLNPLTMQSNPLTLEPESELQETPVNYSIAPRKGSK